MSLRFDRVAIADTRRTAAGVLVVPASLSRTGLQRYRNADGTERIEYRPEQEVFAADALASVRGAVVTVGHVTEQTPKGVGLVSDREPARATRDGEHFIETSLMVTDQAVAARIDRKELVEISLGYHADLDPTPGQLPDGRRYDAVQRNIRVHHAALLPVGHARAGREARIRLDGDEEICNDGNASANAGATANGDTVPVKIKIGDRVFDEGGAEHIAFLEGEIKRERERGDALQKALDTAKADAVAQKARADAAEAKPAPAAPDVSKLVADELAFRDRARPLVGDKYDFAGKSREQIMRDAIGAEACKRVDAQPEAERAIYLRVTFDSAKPGTPAYPAVKTEPVAVADAQITFTDRLKGEFGKPYGGKK